MGFRKNFGKSNPYPGHTEQTLCLRPSKSLLPKAQPDSIPVKTINAIEIGNEVS